MTIILPSVDGDPGANFPQRHGLGRAPSQLEIEAYRSAVRKLFTVFDAHQLTGKVTWFLNEIDVQWRKHYPDLLNDMVARDDTVALHTHSRGLFGSPMLTDRAELFAAALSAKERLEAAMGRKCICHRSGCYYQEEYVYAALADLGFEVVSDVVPGFRGVTKAKALLDNQAVPVGIGAWRHDRGNWMDYGSTSGRFLHVPVSAGSLGDLSRLSQEATERRYEVICWGIHPHELQNDDGTLNEENVEILASALDTMHTRLSPVYMSFDEFRRIPEVGSY